MKQKLLILSLLTLLMSVEVSHGRAQAAPAPRSPRRDVGAAARLRGGLRRVGTAAVAAGRLRDGVRFAGAEVSSTPGSSRDQLKNQVAGLLLPLVKDQILKNTQQSERVKRLLDNTPSGQTESWLLNKIKRLLSTESKSASSPSPDWLNFQLTQYKGTILARRLDKSKELKKPTHSMNRNLILKEWVGLVDLHGLNVTRDSLGKTSEKKTAIVNFFAKLIEVCYFPRQKGARKIEPYRKSAAELVPLAQKLAELYSSGLISSGGGRQSGLLPQPSLSPTFRGHDGAGAFGAAAGLDRVSAHSNGRAPAGLPVQVGSFGSAVERLHQLPPLASATTLRVPPAAPADLAATRRSTAHRHSASAASPSGSPQVSGRVAGRGGGSRPVSRAVAVPAVVDWRPVGESFTYISGSTTSQKRLQSNVIVKFSSQGCGVPQESNRCAWHAVYNAFMLQRANGVGLMRHGTPGFLSDGTDRIAKIIATLPHRDHYSAGDTDRDIYNSQRGDFTGIEAPFRVANYLGRQNNRITAWMDFANHSNTIIFNTHDLMSSSSRRERSGGGASELMSDANFAGPDYPILNPDWTTLAITGNGDGGEQHFFHLDEHKVKDFRDGKPIVAIFRVEGNHWICVRMQYDGNNEIKIIYVDSQQAGNNYPVGLYIKKALYKLAKFMLTTTPEIVKDCIEKGFD